MRGVSEVSSVKRFSSVTVAAKSAVHDAESSRRLAEYLRWLHANAFRPPVNTSGRGPWVVMYQGNTADELRALAASLLIAADQIEDANPGPRSHCVCEPDCNLPPGHP